MKKTVSVKKAAIIAGIALVLTATAVWAKTVHEATGKGAFQDAYGNINSIQFKASVDGSGQVYGGVQNVVQVPAAPNIKYHGTVTCLTLEEPNIATFGGIIDSSTHASPLGEFFVGQDVH